MPLFNSTIDPELPVDARNRREILRSAWRRWNRNPTNGLIFGLGLAAPIFMFPWISMQLTPAQAWTGIPAFLITFICYVIYIGILMHVAKRWRYAPCVYAELRERGYEVCTKCGYWLRDLDDDVQRCPECGRKREEMPTS